MTIVRNVHQPRLVARPDARLLDEATRRLSQWNARDAKESIDRLKHVLRIYA